MSKKDKLIKRFQTIPKDFHWDELTVLMQYLGFVELQGSGSRVKFYNKNVECLIQLHKPHPSKIIKKYMMKEILSTLRKEKLL